MADTPRVGLFVTCIVDAIRPNIGFAAIKLLEQAGCSVEVPLQQVCCGQPAYNSGDDETTAAMARQLIETFEPFDYLVAPSGSCASMIRTHFAGLFEKDSEWEKRQETLSAKTWELLSFLRDERGFIPVDATYNGTATYHDSCSGLRDLGIREQPRELLAHVAGLELTPLEGSEVCCGFGGTFCVKYPQISNAIVSEKIRNIEATQADTLLGGDLGCLMNMAGKLSRNGASVRVYHAAEILAGLSDLPAICGPGED